MVAAGEKIGQTYQENAALSMTGALRFLMRDSRPLQMSKDDMVQLEGVFARFGEFSEFGDIKGDSKGILRGPLLPLSKTVDLLHNVSTRMEVSLNLLQVFTKEGYEHLVKRHAAAAHIEEPEVREAAGGLILCPAVCDAAPACVPAAAAALDARLRALLAGAHARGDLLGAEALVFDAAFCEVLCDLAMGHSSYLRA